MIEWASTVEQDLQITAVMIALKDSHGNDLGDGDLENFAYLRKNPGYVN